jgi:hypothetical protein
MCERKYSCVCVRVYIHAYIHNTRANAMTDQDAGGGEPKHPTPTILILIHMHTYTPTQVLVEDKRAGAATPATPTLPKSVAQTPTPYQAQNTSTFSTRSETPQQQGDTGSDEAVGVSLSLDEDYDSLVRDSSRLQEFNVLLKQDLARALRCVCVCV